MVQEFLLVLYSFYQMECDSAEVKQHCASCEPTAVMILAKVLDYRPPSNIHLPQLPSGYNYKASKQGVLQNSLPIGMVTTINISTSNAVITFHYTNGSLRGQRTANVLGWK